MAGAPLSSNWPPPQIQRKPETSRQTECARRKELSRTHLEVQSKHFADADLRTLRQCLLHILLQPFAVKPSAVRTLVSDEELPRGGVAAQHQMLARYFIVCI